MTNIRKLAARAILLSLVAVPAVRAQTAQCPGCLIPTVENPPTRAGTRLGNFLHIGIGARGNAMAGAVGSVINGSTAWFWNPAGAATIESFGITAGRQKLYGDMDITQTYAAVSYPLFGGAIGLTLNSLNSGQMLLTDEGAPFSNAARGASFAWTSSAVGFGFARRLTDRLDIGGGFKLITEGLPQVHSTSFAVDVGTQFRTGLFGLMLSGSLQSVGTGAAMNGVQLERGVSTNDVSLSQTKFKLFTRPMELPTAFQFSVGDDLYGGAESLLGRGSGQHTLFSEISINDAVDMAVQAAIGAEYGYKNMLFARAGKKFYNDGRAPEKGQAGHSSMYGMSGGFGVRFPVSGRAIRFDYSYTALGDLRDIQVFSFDFGGR